MTSPRHDIELLVGDNRFTGWTRVEVVRSLDQFADAWSVEAITRWAVTPDPDISMAIDLGDEAEFWWGELELVRGWLDEISENAAEREWSIGLAGRSRAGDLVDCTAIRKGSWRERSVLEIAKDLVAPFGLTVVVGALADFDVTVTSEKAVSTTKRDRLGRFAVDGEETVADCLQRLAAFAGVRVRSTPRGDVEFYEPGKKIAPTALRWGGNIRSVGRQRSMAERFSDYVIRAQVNNSDAWNAKAASVGASVKDPGVLRHRPLRIKSKVGAAKDKLHRKAEWERNTRAGKSDVLEVQVYAAERTWLAGPGMTWEPGMLVPTYVPHLDLDAMLLVKDVNLSYGADGFAARLTLTHPEAYQPEVPPKKKGKKGKYSW